MTSFELRNWLGRATPAIYVFALVMALVGSLAIKVRFRGVFACPASYGSSAYLSDCNAASYGDYDHGAFWYGLEPEARRAAGKAKVVFLGNSRLQFALSTPNTVKWFAQRAISFYLLGFSHYETVMFVTPVLAKIEPHASAYVIHADRFFDDWVSRPSGQILRDRDTRARYREKQFWQTLHKHACGTLAFLCGDELAVYRTISNGTWNMSGELPDRGTGVSEGWPTNVERWPEYISLANKFVGQLGVSRRCVLLTLVPTVETKRAEAQAIADALGLQLIAPRIDDLRTFDGSHLEAASAARWSAAFFAAAGPAIENCANNGATSASTEPGRTNGNGR